MRNRIFPIYKSRIGSFAHLSAGRRWEKFRPVDAGDRDLYQGSQRGRWLVAALHSDLLFPVFSTILVPYPSDDMICWPVSARVGNVKNNDPALIEPVAAVTAH